MISWDTRETPPCLKYIFRDDEKSNMGRSGTRQSQVTLFDHNGFKRLKVMRFARGPQLCYCIFSMSE